MNPEQVIERAKHVEAAWDAFIRPAIEAIRADYMAGLTRIASEEPWSSEKIVKLAIATRVIDKVEAQLRAAMGDGEHAAASLARASEIEKIPAARRRILGI